MTPASAVAAVPAKGTSDEQGMDEPRRVITQHSSAVGSSGILNYSGYFSEEYLQEVRGRKAADIWDRLRRSDAKVKMVLKAVKAPILGAKWDAEPASQDPKHILHKDLVEQVLFRDQPQSWTQHIKEFLTSLDFGHAPFEVTHRPVMNHPKFGSYSSIARIGWRSPRTIERWNLDPDTGALVSITQTAFGDLRRNVDIPGQFLIVFTHDREGDNYEGVSALRPCYGPWKRKNVYQTLMAVGIEKYAVPTPKMKVPAGKEKDPAFDDAKEILEKFTSHEQQYIMYPEGWDLDFASPSNFDASKIKEAISGENAEIASAFLTNFLELGQGSSGSWALSTDLSDFMLLSIEHVATEICEVLNRTLVRQIVDMNFGPQAEYPTIKVSGIKDKAGKELAELLRALVDGKLLTPDTDLEDDLRKKYSLTKRMQPAEPVAVPATTLATPAGPAAGVVPSSAAPAVGVPDPAKLLSEGVFLLQRIEVSKKIAATDAEARRLAEEIETIPVTAQFKQNEFSYQFDLARVEDIAEGTLKSFEPTEGVTVYFGRRREQI